MIFDLNCSEKDGTPEKVSYVETTVGRQEKMDVTLKLL